uniref:Uncharacterized protein n=1 Tax=Glossina pallidipes TaxID=7398 RepID=A0A1A9ZNR1_GLOPL
MSASRPSYKVNQCESHKLKIVTAADDNGTNGDEDEEKNVTEYLSGVWLVTQPYTINIPSLLGKNSNINQCNSLSNNFTVKFGTGILFEEPTSVEIDYDMLVEYESQREGDTEARQASKQFRFAVLHIQCIVGMQYVKSQSIKTYGSRSLAALVNVKLNTEEFHCDWCPRIPNLVKR